MTSFLLLFLWSSRALRWYDTESYFFFFFALEIPQWAVTIVFIARYDHEQAPGLLLAGRSCMYVGSDSGNAMMRLEDRHVVRPRTRRDDSLSFFCPSVDNVWMKIMRHGWCLMHHGQRTLMSLMSKPTCSTIIIQMIKNTSVPFSDFLFCKSQFVLYIKKRVNTQLPGRATRLSLLDLHLLSEPNNHGQSSPRPMSWHTRQRSYYMCSKASYYWRPKS